MDAVNKLASDILVAFGLIAINGCFVLAEFALVKIRASRLEVLARKGNLRAVMVQGMLQEIDVYLSAIQMGITMTSLGIGWIGEPAVASLLERNLLSIPSSYASILAHAASLILAFGAITFLHILLGELVPRTIGLQKAETVILWAALPLKAFTLAFKLPVTILANASKGVLKLLRITTTSQAEPQFSEEEIRVILGSSEEKADVPLERLMLLENIFDFGTAKVSEAMTPRSKIAFLSVENSWRENLEIIRTRRFSRYLLCGKGLDSVLGYIHVKDIVLSPDALPDLEKIMRPLETVSPGDLLHKLLQKFAGKGIRIAAVVDESKEIVGITTLEDLLEELVGEIHDEFDFPHAWSLMEAIRTIPIEFGIESADRPGVIRKLLERLNKSCPEFNIEEAFQAVWTRESILSSAIGHGIAIPHGRLPHLSRPLMVIGRAGKPFPFQPMDKIPIRLAFLILTPAAQPALQLRILARVATLLANDNLRRRLLRAKSEENFAEILKTADTVMAS